MPVVVLYMDISEPAWLCFNVPLEPVIVFALRVEWTDEHTIKNKKIINECVLVLVRCQRSCTISVDLSSFNYMTVIIFKTTIQYFLD